MYDIYSRPDRSHFSGLLVLFGGVLVGMFAGSSLSMLIWTMSTGKEAITLQYEMNNPAYKYILRWIQVVSTFFMFFVPSVFMSMYMSRRAFRFLGFNGFVSNKQYVLTILIMLAALPLSGALGEVNKIIPLSPALTAKFKMLEDQYMQQVKAISGIKGFPDYMVTLVLMCLLPALFEEMLFRGGVQNLLFRQTKHLWLSVIVTSIIFSAIHMSFYGFLPRLMLGIVLGLLYQWSGSIWLAVIGHFANNAIGVSQLYWYQRKGKTIEQLMLEDSTPLWAGCIGLIVIIGLFILFHQQSRKDRKELVPAEDQANEEQWMT
jgi:membrane protease YdiL (CAAX protease family)